MAYEYIHNYQAFYVPNVWNGAPAMPPAPPMIQGDLWVIVGGVRSVPPAFEGLTPLPRNAPARAGDRFYHHRHYSNPADHGQSLAAGSKHIGRSIDQIIDDGEYLIYRPNVYSYRAGRRLPGNKHYGVPLPLP